MQKSLQLISWLIHIQHTKTHSVSSITTMSEAKEDKEKKLLPSKPKNGNDASKTDKLLPIVQVYIKKFDDKLEEMLDEFDNYDYTYKSLLTQSEFEEEFLPIFKKVLRRSNKYDLIFAMFDIMVMKSLNDLHKLLSLIDFMINISRYDPSTFKNLPNDIVAKVAEESIFPKIQEFIYNKGRMNYPFNNFIKQANELSINAMVEEIDSDDTNEERQRSATPEVDNELEINTNKRINDISLAELTKKIMSKSKPKFQKPKSGERFYVRTETPDYDDAQILEEYESESDNISVPSDNSDSDYDSKISTKNIHVGTTKNLRKSTLEQLVDSDHEIDVDSEKDENNMKKGKTIVTIDDEEEESGEEEDNEDEDESEDESDDEILKDAIDNGMTNSTSIIEHIIEYENMGSGSTELASRISKPKKKRTVEQKIRESDTLKKRKISKEKSIKSKQVKKSKSKKEKSSKRRSSVRRKTYYVLEKTLDFLYTELETHLPLSKSTLLKPEVKGFSYKPAQYSLFANLPESITNTDSDINEKIDNLLNSLIFQLSKRCGGNQYDTTPFLHPFEYDYIMKNLPELSKKATKLPPFIFSERFSSMFGYDNYLSKNIDLLRIKNTKIKGLLWLKVSLTEDEYFNMFKKIVPREKVAQRIEYLNTIITDGKNLYFIDVLDSIKVAMENIPRLTYDSEDEEDILRQQEESNKQSEPSVPVEIAEKAPENTEKEAEAASEKTESDDAFEDAQETADPDPKSNDPPEDIEMNKVESASEKTNNTVNPLESEGIKNDVSTHNIKVDVTTALTNLGEKLTEDHANQATEIASDANIDKNETEKTDGKTVDDKENNSTDPNTLKTTLVDEKSGVEIKIDSNSSLNDPRESVYCSSKGIALSSRSVKKVLSTQQLFDLLAAIFFPEFKFNLTYPGIPYSSLRPLSEAYDPLRPYLLSLLLQDVYEFSSIPKYFKVDSVVFELQIQELIKSGHPNDNIKRITAKVLE